LDLSIKESRSLCFETNRNCSEDVLKIDSKPEKYFGSNTAANSEEEEEEPLEPNLMKHNSESFIKNLKASIGEGWTILDSEATDYLKENKNQLNCHNPKIATRSIDSISQYTNLSYDQHRQRYIKTLVQKKVLNEEAISKSNVVSGIIFDWDNTLFPFLVLKSMKQEGRTIDVVPISLQSELNKLEDAAIEIIEKCSKITSYVFIVTNAPSGWVQNSCCRLMPRLAESLKTLKIGILSARGVFHPHNPTQPLQWKNQAFQWIGQYLAEKSVHLSSLVVIGDSDCELEAGKQFAKSFQVPCLKQILVKANTIIQYQKQLNWLSKKIENIVYSTTSESLCLDLRL